MWQTIKKYGIRSAVVMVVLSWLSFFITRGMAYWISQVASMLIIVGSLLFIYSAMRVERERAGGQISFWQYFFTGALTGLVPAVIMILSTIIFMLTAGGAYSSWAEGEPGQQAVIMNPVEQGIIMFLIILFIGSIMSLLGAIVFSARNR